MEGGHSCTSFKAVLNFSGNSQRIIDTSMGQAYNYIFKGKGPSKLYPIKACHEAHWLDVMISCTSHIVWKYYLRFSGTECLLWLSKVAEKPTQSFDIEPISLLPNSLTFNWQTFYDLDTDHWSRLPIASSVKLINLYSCVLCNVSLGIDRDWICEISCFWRPWISAIRLQRFPRSDVGG